MEHKLTVLFTTKDGTTCPVKCDSVVVFINKKHPKPFLSIDGNGCLQYPKTSNEMAYHAKDYYDYLDELEENLYEALKGINDEPA